ncbi:hypothetical protein MTR67_051536 [Solanum verrucosum]|uniref:Uncharacterized protein n=1 Tax=Solanum verrucosum TaxID=315347 RepID=A0AAF0V7M6_SOLVR|nr:hypothetical protein MTR67_051536 [Solanum verrucosum]
MALHCETVQQLTDCSFLSPT